MPAIARFLFGISWIFFPVHGEFKENMLADLEERRAKRVSEMEASADSTESTDTTEE